MTRRRIGATVALVAAIAVVVAIVLSTQSSTPARASGGTPAPAAGVTTVQRRNLVQTDTESGTLTYANPQTVYNRLSGTITWLPSVGALIKPGHALFRVDGEPVILMKGGTPAFRDLNGYDTPGPDILELNRNLIALGDNPDGIVADDTWQPATTAGVDILQASLGQSETGDLTLGQIIFLPGPQLVSTLDTTVGSTGGGAAGSSGATGASDPVGAAKPEFVSLTVTGPNSTPPGGAKPKGGQHGGSKPKGGTSPKKAPGSSSNIHGLISMLQSEIAKLQAELAAAKNGGGNAPGSAGSKNNSGGSSGGGSSGGGSSGGGSSGGGSSGGGSSGGGSSGGTSGGSASAILQTSSKQLVVTVDLDASKQSEAKLGEKVTVEMPSGQTVPGKIIGVSPVAQSSSGSSDGGGAGGASSPGASGSSGGTSTVPVTVKLTGRVRGAGLDQAAVSVNFVQAQAKNVLSVAVTALLATSGGGFALQEAGAPHKLVPVHTGLFAAGYVQVSGPGVYSGLAVTDSEG